MWARRTRATSAFAQKFFCQGKSGQAPHLVFPPLLQRLQLLRLLTLLAPEFFQDEHSLPITVVTCWENVGVHAVAKVNDLKVGQHILSQRWAFYGRQKKIPQDASKYDHKIRPKFTHLKLPWVTSEVTTELTLLFACHTGCFYSWRLQKVPHGVKG